MPGQAAPAYWIPEMSGTMRGPTLVRCSRVPVAAILHRHHLRGRTNTLPRLFYTSFLRRLSSAERGRKRLGWLGFLLTATWLGATSGQDVGRVNSAQAALWMKTGNVASKSAAETAPLHSTPADTTS